MLIERIRRGTHLFNPFRIGWSDLGILFGILQPVPNPMVEPLFIRSLKRADLLCLRIKLAILIHYPAVHFI